MPNDNDITVATGYRYPIDTESHVKAAISYLSMPKNQKHLTNEELAGAWRRIHAAAKRFGIEVDVSKGYDLTNAFNGHAPGLFGEPNPCVRFALLSLVEEIEAAEIYQARIEHLEAFYPDESMRPAHVADLLGALEHAREEEFEHADSFVEWLEEHTKDVVTGREVAVF